MSRNPEATPAIPSRIGQPVDRAPVAIAFATTINPGSVVSAPMAELPSGYTLSARYRSTV